jgi:hypothetical protein
MKLPISRSRRYGINGIELRATTRDCPYEPDCLLGENPLWFLLVPLLKDGNAFIKAMQNTTCMMQNIKEGMISAQRR